MPVHIVRGNLLALGCDRASSMSCAAQKCQLGLLVRTVAMVRARVRIGLANLTDNFTRLAWLSQRGAPA
jgi:hypothetical protein